MTSAPSPAPSAAAPTTQTALKEWAVAIKALDKGRQILLLRKGGIHEKEFSLASQAFLLYPTYEHQRQDLLKPSEHAVLDSVLREAPPAGMVSLRHWARATTAFELTHAEQVAALAPFHIWTERYIEERLRWRPTRPLLALLVRVYRLAQPCTLPVLPAYGGCRSWIDLDATPDLAGAQPVLDDAAYAARVEEIRAALRPVMPEEHGRRRP